MTYYGRWTYKFEEAARRGALGMLVVHETAPASYGWDTVKNSNTATHVRHRSIRIRRTVHPLLEGWMQRDVAVDLFKRVGLDFDAEKKKAQSASFKPVPLGNATFSLDYTVTQARVDFEERRRTCWKGPPIRTRRSSTRRTGITSGSALPDATGDRIYNGARDNALGVASVLELARVYAAAPRTIGPSCSCS